MSKRVPCAACGAARVCRKVTFNVSGFCFDGEYHICNSCWSEGENDEAWNDAITKRIVTRLARTQPAQVGERR